MARRIIEQNLNDIPKKMTSQNPFVFHEASSQELGAREMSRQQWEKLKPLIKRVYIEEKKTFPHLAKILRKEHGFEPT
jgi:hypothetical protein